ncbi:hypothetical protein K9N50_02625 [bacterium]|nr:hypothetical protein [bacterium]
MLEDLSLLIRLQEIDEELMDIEAELGDRPERLNNLKRETDRFKAEIEKLNATLDEIHTQKKEQRQIVERAMEQLKKSQSVIYSVKTTREYDAISSEIEQSQTMIRNSEKLLEELSIREDELEIEILNAKEILKNTEVEYREQKSDIQDQISSSDDEVSSLKTEREEIVSKIKHPVYSHYQRIRKLRDGIGIAYLTDNACGYCFSKVPPQRQVEIRRMDDVILCEGCGCIIVAQD